MPSEERNKSLFLFRPNDGRTKGLILFIWHWKNLDFEPKMAAAATMLTDRSHFEITVFKKTPAPIFFISIGLKS